METEAKKDVGAEPDQVLLRFPDSHGNALAIANGRLYALDGVPPTCLAQFAKVDVRCLVLRLRDNEWRTFEKSRDSAANFAEALAFALEPEGIDATCPRCKGTGSRLAVVPEEAQRFGNV